jgi:hypothetical protein
VMKTWTVWNWIAYGNIALASFGLALGTFVRTYPELLTKVPVLFSNPKWSFVPAVLVIVGTVIFIVRPPSLARNSNAPVRRASLSIRSHADHRYPSEVATENIWGWFYFRSIFVMKNIETGEEKETTQAILFISFDHPVINANMTIESRDFRLPRYEVKRFDSRFAVVSFEHEPPAGVLEIETS